MAQKTTFSRSLSDSEVNERSSKPFVLDHHRAKRYSGSQLTNIETTNIVEPLVNLNNPCRTLIDYQTCATAISSSSSTKDKQIGYERNVPGELEPLQEEDISSDNQELQQHHNLDENCKKEEYRTPKTSSFRNSTAESTPGEHNQNSLAVFKIPVSSNDCLHQVINISQSEENSMRNAQFSEKSVENSVIYPILEVSNNKENFIVPSEDFIGEPRCLALKKYATDDDMDDALELNFDDLDEDEEFDNDQLSKPISSSKNTQKKNVDDMFLDEEDVVEVQDSNKSNNSDFIKSKINWDKPVTEKEEGELTPDLYSTTHSDGGDSKSTRSKKQDNKESIPKTREKKPERKESNQDFFLKINRCFRQLEREFCNMHVPRGSRRLIGQLQNTLCNVDRMKRRLAFLIDSAKNVSSDRTKNSKDDRHSSSRRGSFDDGKSKSSSGRPEKSTSELLHDTIRSQKEAEARMNRHIRRTASSVAYAGTKEEKQRIQSLFKRQMNLITQHVIQKKDQGKNQNPKTGESRLKKEDKKAPEKTKSPELKTLDEMEAFLAVLKIQKIQKDEIITKDKQKKQQGPLRFTTKKAQSVSERRPQPVLLVGANPPQAISTQNQVDVTDETEWEKQMDVLKALSDKRKEILKNKKDYEEVRLLQEQLRKLTQMDTEPSSTPLNANTIQATKEQNVSANKSAAKESKEILSKETESKKAEETSFKGEINNFVSVRKDPKEIECIKPTFQPRPMDCEDVSHGIISENSKKLKKRKFQEEEDEILSSETLKSDKDLKGTIFKKKDRAESGGELSSHKKHLNSERKSQKSRHHRSDSKEASIIDGRFDEKLREELMSKKLLIVGDKNIALLNERFSLKVIGNQIYLKKMGRRTKRKGKGRREQKIRKNIGTIDGKTVRNSHSLEEMENFLQQLRSKKNNVLSGEEEGKEYIPKSNQPSKEMKFMARIQAKRKAKLMACGSTTEITQKEAKFLKDLENQARNTLDSPETEQKKQKLMQKIREETDAIVLHQKLADDDPLSDVKNFLSMIKEAELSNDEKSKQLCVSFSMKRSEVKQLENITSGKASELTEESQKFLNSVRAKMRAKKASVADLSEQKG